VPGRTIRGWFKATREGKYEFICAEICGIGHTMMKAAMHVEPPSVYRQWLQSKTKAARAETVSREEQG
jgi:cytochrome c oxidase subunit 2